MKRFISIAVAALLLAGSLGMLLAQQAPETDQPERVYPSDMPAHYNLIVDRGMFGFFPRQDLPVEPDAGQGAPMGMPPDTLPDFQHDPGMNTGRDIPAGPSFSLTAVMQVDDAFKAIVVDNASGDGHYVAEGDTVAGYAVTNIGPGRVVLNNGQEDIVLKIDVPKPPSALVPQITTPKKDRQPTPEPDIQRLPPHVQPRIGR
jgi:hypothetical protein